MLRTAGAEGESGHTLRNTGLKLRKTFDRLFNFGSDKGTVRTVHDCRARWRRRLGTPHDRFGSMGSQAVMYDPVAVVRTAVPGILNWLAQAAGAVAVSICQSYQASKVAVIDWVERQYFFISCETDMPWAFAVAARRDGMTSRFMASRVCRPAMVSWNLPYDRMLSFRCQAAGFESRRPLQWSSCCMKSRASWSAGSRVEPR